MRKTICAWPLLAMLLLTPLFLAGQSLPGGSAFTVTRDSGDGIQINFQLPAWELETVERDGASYARVRLDGIPKLFIGEEETLPVFISAPQVLRDFRVVSLNVHPFQWDSATGELLVRDHLTLNLDFDNGPSVNETIPAPSLSPAFEKIYRGLILNYDQAAGRNADYHSPRLLVIYGNYADASYQGKVDEYVAWKRQKGYLVEAASTATTGTSNSAIKAYIQTRYDNPETRPDYIVLIGDDSGTIAVPSYSTYIDYYYTWLAGSDNLGDVAIGRISVDSTAEMWDYMAKINYLEKDINLDLAAWLDRVVLVGDTASSGISTVYTNEYVYDASIAINPDYTYTKIYSSDPPEPEINAAINQGVAFYNYRGYLGMSGWPNYISTMNNTYKLFHGVFITCATGSWGGGTSTTESVVRFGTEATLGGAVTAIGMATTGTHTPMNNCLDVGIFHGIYPLGMRNMSEAMLYGKLYLYAVYGISNSTQAYNFSGFCNLIGDPTAPVYVGIPSQFSVDAPTSIPAGETNLLVNVSDGANPVPGASVALTNSAGQQALAFTDASGNASLAFAANLSGSLQLTVSQNDFKPFIQSVSIASTGGLVYDGLNIDDSASGNGDGEANAGEAMDIYVSLLNTTSGALSPFGEASCSDPYISLTNYDRIDFNAIAPGASGESVEPISLQIAPDCPDQHQFVLRFELNDGLYSTLIPLTVSNGRLEVVSRTFVGSSGNLVNPGDAWPLTLTLQNVGSAPLTGLSATLSSQDSFFEITDGEGYYGAINAGATAGNNTDTFSILARSTCVDGMVIPLLLELSNPDGFQQSIPLSFTIGQTSLTDPLGQDAYGYFIFGMEDSGYDQCPVYDWIGIAPAEGGSGTALNLTDPGNAGDEGDQNGAVSIQTVNLPFTFKYYGVDYSQASISSNGFIAFGATQNSDWRNLRLPGPGGAHPMLAVFWDDLELGTGSAVYTWYNSALNYYVVQWHGLYSGYDSISPETFQAILYDPTYYPTHTGDGQIKLQYKDFNNIDTGNSEDHWPHANYCTIGIEDHTETIGLEYTFGNSYPTAAAPLTDESALFITTRPILPDSAYLSINQVEINDTNANGHLEAGESALLPISLRNRGLVDATNVSALLSSADPHVSVTAASAAYGTVLAQDVAYPHTNFAIQVAANCPPAHDLVFTLDVTADSGTWSYNLPLRVYAPELQFGSYLISDPGGDGDGVLDPGETVAVSIPLLNSGEVASEAGSATLASSTPGISILGGTDSFGPIGPDGMASLSFTISASPATALGTIVELAFAASAGSISLSRTEYAVVGIIMETFETGNFNSLPWVQGANPWVIDSSTFHAGANSARSGTIGNSSLTSLEVTRVLPASGQLSFWYKVSSESNYDFLKFYVDGVQQGSWSGEVDWTQATYTLATGTRVLKWVYSKDYAMTSGSDCAWIDDIVFPASTNPSVHYPAENLSAAASHGLVLLNWTAPLYGTPSGYNIFRDSALLTSVTDLSHTDYSVNDGTTYNYYVVASYPEGDSDPTATASATPNTYPPTALAALPGNTVVDLSWTAAEGRGARSAFAANPGRDISGYRIYRDGSPLTTVAATTFQDAGLTNGVTYNYYVTTLYSGPAGESAPSNTVSATPNLISEVVLGDGTSSTGISTACPINITYKSLHGQSVYTAAELNAQGVSGPLYITGLAFWVNTPPDYVLPDFRIRLKHTTDANVANWQGATDMVTVFSADNYLPTAGGWDMLTFQTPFLWNGSQNIVVDTAFNLTEEWTQSGTVRYSSVASGYRCARDDYSDQTNVFSGTYTSPNRPNLKLALLPFQTGPEIAVDPLSLDFGEVELGSGSVQQFSITNSGDALLSGSGRRPSATP